MDENNLKTSRHMGEVLVRPNPFILEAVKTYLAGQRIDMSNFGRDFLNVYLEIERQMYATIAIKKQEEAKEEEKRSIL